MQFVKFPDGTKVRAASLAERKDEDSWREFGLYLDEAWRPSWPSDLIPWEDRRLPGTPAQAVDQIVAAFKRAKKGQHVEVGCKGGLGRTGTVLACMAVLAGVPREEAVSWVRQNYERRAVETDEQVQCVLWFADEVQRRRAWCVFRNLVHAVYREVRHLGPNGDSEARVTVSGGPLLPCAMRCRRARAELKSRGLYETSAQANSTTDVLKPYQEKTGLSVDDAILVFKLPNWKPRYGGPKWAAIAETLKQLVSALEAGDSVRAGCVAQEVFRLQHNKGPLVPSRAEWERKRYLQEKWPGLCD